MSLLNFLNKSFFNKDREIFYPFSKIFQVSFDENAPKEIKKEKEEKEKKKVDANHTFRKIFEFSNLEAKSKNLNSFFEETEEADVTFIPSAGLIKENEKEMIENEEIKSIMGGNTLNIVKNSTTEQNLYSLAGQIRKEWVKFYDHDKNEIIFTEKKVLEILFVNNTFNEIIVYLIYF